MASPGDLSRQMMQGVVYHSGGYIPRTNTTTTNTTPIAANPPAVADFKGLPFDFAMGEVYGLRMWKMDKYGRLRARNWDTAPPWRPGVNVAKCVERPEDNWSLSINAISSVMGVQYPREPKKPKHETPAESCACGFYAYTDELHAETQPYKHQKVILGIIKGTGRTLLGTKGFRCEKAEIVALRDPTRGGLKADEWRVEQADNLRRLYPDVPLLESRAALLEFAPLTETLPDPTSDEFWALP
jgi:hypothetical protein